MTDEEKKALRKKMDQLIKEVEELMEIMDKHLQDSE